MKTYNFVMLITFLIFVEIFYQYESGLQVMSLCFNGNRKAE